MVMVDDLLLAHDGLGDVLIDHRPLVVRLAFGELQLQSNGGCRGCRTKP